ncbi:MAG: hypothetical protein GX058_06045 [Firmicutes bacterium]|nr:hypothetical protein [Bacillota bacterium]
MPLTVEQLLESDILAGATVVAGAKGLNNPIRWVHICELPSSGERLLGNELVLTTGEILRTRAERMEFIQGLALAKIAALVLFFDSGARKVPSYWTELADEWSIPVLLAPPGSSYIRVCEEANLLLQMEGSKETSWRMLRAEPLITTRIMAFFQDVLAGEIAGRGVVELAADRLGLPAGSRYSVLIFNYRRSWQADEMHETIAAVSNIISDSTLPAWCIPADFWQNRLAIVVSVGEEETAEKLRQFASVLNSRLEQRFPKYRASRIGIGRAYPIYELPKSYREARQASEGPGIQEQSTPFIQHFRDLGLYRLLYAIEDKRELVAFYRESIAPLVEHDRTYKHELLRTLEVYFQYEGNLTETAQALYIHRHTLRYRLQRVEQLTGLKLKKFDERLTLLLGLMIWRMLERRN